MDRNLFFGKEGRSTAMHRPQLLQRGGYLYKVRNDEFAVDRNLANSRSIFTHALPFPFLSSFLFSFSSLFPLFPDLAARRWPSVLLPIPSSPPWPAVLLPIPYLCLPLPLSPSLPLLHG